MHRLSASFVLGYHGCTRAVGEKILKTGKFLRSANDYDWLGHGVYFWEANPQRGLEFIDEKLKREKSSAKPFVVGAVLDLGNCLDLTTSTGASMVRVAYERLYEDVGLSQGVMPSNSQNGLLRRLDCAVINQVHLIVRASHSVKSAPPIEAIDSVKGAFVEGAQLYPNAGFREKTHIQIAIVNEDRCIKGVFRVPDKHLNR